MTEKRLDLMIWLLGNFLAAIAATLVGLKYGMVEAFVVFLGLTALADIRKKL